MSKQNTASEPLPEIRVLIGGEPAPELPVGRAWRKALWVCISLPERVLRKAEPPAASK